MKTLSSAYNALGYETDQEQLADVAQNSNATLADIISAIRALRTINAESPSLSNLYQALIHTYETSKSKGQDPLTGNYTVFLYEVAKEIVIAYMHSEKSQEVTHLCKTITDINTYEGGQVDCGLALYDILEACNKTDRNPEIYFNSDVVKAARMSSKAVPKSKWSKAEEILVEAVIRDVKNKKFSDTPEICQIIMSKVGNEALLALQSIVNACITAEVIHCCFGSIEAVGILTNMFEDAGDNFTTTFQNLKICQIKRQTENESLLLQHFAACIESLKVLGLNSASEVFKARDEANRLMKQREHQQLLGHWQNFLVANPYCDTLIYVAGAFFELGSSYYDFAAILLSKAEQYSPENITHLMSIVDTYSKSTSFESKYNFITDIVRIWNKIASLSSKAEPIYRAARALEALKIKDGATNAWIKLGQMKEATSEHLLSAGGHLLYLDRQNAIHCFTRVAGNPTSRLEDCLDAVLYLNNFNSAGKQFYSEIVKKTNEKLFTSIRLPEDPSSRMPKGRLLCLIDALFFTQNVALAIQGIEYFQLREDFTFNDALWIINILEKYNLSDLGSRVYDRLPGVYVSGSSTLKVEPLDPSKSVASNQGGLLACLSHALVNAILAQNPDEKIIGNALYDDAKNILGFRGLYGVPKYHMPHVNMGHMIIALKQCGIDYRFIEISRNSLLQSIINMLKMGIPVVAMFSPFPEACKKVDGKLMVDFEASLEDSLKSAAASRKKDGIDAGHAISVIEYDA